MSSYAAEIVIKKDDVGYGAGFASRTKGKTVASYGKWYSSQMSYEPFKRAWAAAIEEASRLNAGETGRK